MIDEFETTTRGAYPLAHPEQPHAAASGRRDQSTAIVLNGEV
jgi:hypothetical protein